MSVPSLEYYEEIVRKNITIIEILNEQANQLTNQFSVESDLYKLGQLKQQLTSKELELDLIRTETRAIVQEIKRLRIVARSDQYSINQSAMYAA